MKTNGMARWWMFGVACALLFCAAAFADSNIRIVRLSYTNGDVNIDRGEGSGTERAVTNMPIVEGTRLWTNGDGQAEVEFEDGSTLRLVPNSSVEFTRLSLRDAGYRVNQVSIGTGTVYVDVMHFNKHDEFLLRLPKRSFVIDRNVHFRLEVLPDQARLAVFNGDIEVAGLERNVNVRRGETLAFDFNDNRFTLENEIVSALYDTWDKDRSSVLANVKYDRKWYPYGYGYADLVNYGTFINVNGFGTLWRPIGVGIGWDPFDFGYWCYYPWGYTFVSGYDWGWAPYRYGRWLWVNGYGWMWNPSGGGQYWNPNPAYYGKVPPEWHPPRPPARPVNGPAPIISIGYRGPGRYPVGGGRTADVGDSRDRGRPIGSGPSVGVPAVGKDNVGTPITDRDGRPIRAANYRGDGKSSGPASGSPAPGDIKTPVDEVRDRGNRDHKAVIDLTPPGGNNGPSIRGGDGDRRTPAINYRGNDTPSRDTALGAGNGPAGRRTIESPASPSGPRVGDNRGASPSSGGGESRHPIVSPARTEGGGSGPRWSGGNSGGSPAPSPHFEAPRMDSAPRMSAPAMSPPPPSAPPSSGAGSSGGGGNSHSSSPPSSHQNH